MSLKLQVTSDKMLSLCLATHNEASNIHYPLNSCINWVDEVVIVDGRSTDKTVEIAKKYGKKVHIYTASNPKMFHINKQKALDYAKGEWILQLDADEAVSPDLAEEIKKVIKMNQKELENHQSHLKKKKLFNQHQKLLEQRNGPISKKNDQYVAFFVPRLNYFLGRFLRHGGVYPDGAIRLVKKGRAKFPCKDVHEIMTVNGRVGWLDNDLYHYDSPTFKRYIDRNNRYINLMVDEMKQNKLSKSFITWIDWNIYKPIDWFLTTYFRHRGFIDGWQGFVFSFFSALRFPRAYFKYIYGKKEL